MILRKLIACVADRELLTVNKRVLSVDKRVGHAAEHPYVDLAGDVESFVLVNHLGRPVHHGSILFIMLKGIFDSMVA